jgi:putative ABC transport system ATP-binding protein
MTVAIDVRGLTREYHTAAGPVHALRGVDLTVDAGRCIAIVGPSGCGKSTLLSVIGALEVPSAGSVNVFGTDVGSLAGDGRALWRGENVGFVFQAYDLFPFLTAIENVAFQAGLSRAEAPENAGEMLLRLGMAGHEDKLPDQLSGGQKQRVGIARSLIHRPRLVLADEPTGGLDRATSQTVVDVLLAAVRAIDATLVMVTHDQEVASRLDDVIELRDGQVVQAAHA